LEWYYARGEERLGPVDDGELAHLAASGAVTSETLVWREGMADWQPYGAAASAPGMDADLPPSIFGGQPPQFCAECGRAFRSEDMVSYGQHWVCAGCKEVFFQRIREGGAPAGVLRYAGFWIRFGARLIDGVIVHIGIYAVGFLVGLGGLAHAVLVAMVFSSIGVPMAYEVYFLGRHGATPGKMAVGLRVVMSDGAPPSYGRAFGRFFAYLLSRITLYIGCIIAAFDEEKRALHDHICDTRVVFK